MTRYEDFVSKEAKGVTFESAKRVSCEQLDKACNIKADDNSANYANPPIPEGFVYITGKWNTGLVIESIVSGSQYVWVPTGILAPNGTIDGKNFSEKFGRRNYMEDEFSEDCFIDPLDDEEFKNQFESVKKHGGFYISRYNISASVCSKALVIPCMNNCFSEVKKLAESAENTEAVKSHLIYGAEYDSVLEWFIQSKARTYAEIAEDSSNWGNYKKSNEMSGNVTGLHCTGTNEAWFTNNIADLAGNLSEWTQEVKDDLYHVIRGGNYYQYSKDYPVACRNSSLDNDSILLCGFRVALYIK